MDAISLLEGDHRDVERLFKRFENTSDRALVERRRIVDEIIRALSVHAEIEETVFYPAVRRAVPPSEEMVLESLEEHHVVKWVLSELEGMPADAERFEAKVTVLIESVRHHVQEEESDLFPKVRRALSRTALDDLGESLQRAKLVAPTRPHPRSPDTPPANIVTGVVASALDRAREAGQELVEGAAGVARRAAANATGGSPPAPRTRRRRKAAAKKASGSAKKASRSAKRTSKRTAKKASGSAKKVTRATKATARKAARTTRRTAKKAARTTTGTAKKAARTTKGTAKKATRTTKGTAKKATRTTKATARKAVRTTKGTAKRTAKKATRSTKATARKTTGRARTAAKKRS